MLHPAFLGRDYGEGGPKDQVNRGLARNRAGAEYLGAVKFAEIMITLACPKRRAQIARASRNVHATRSLATEQNRKASFSVISRY
jgi:hypothetical protein